MPVNTDLILSLTESDEPITEEKLQVILKKHQAFLASGGEGGHWQTFSTEGGLVLGIYLGAEGSEGEQAQLQHKKFEGINLRNIEIRFANMVGIICRGQDLSGSRLQGSLITDSDLSGSSFVGADLSWADFSRSRMKNCNFQNADLTNTDFENADLSGSDLRGAKIDGTMFPGTILTDVLKD